MNRLEALNSPLVCLGHLSDDSIAVSVYVLVRHGAERRPDLAAALRGRVCMRFADGYSPVRIDFRGDEIEVAEEGADSDRAYDLELSGRLGDVSALIATPLAGGVPKPTTRRGRRAIVRLADRRVDIDGSWALARNLLRLLGVDAPTVATRSQISELQRT